MTHVLNTTIDNTPGQLGRLARALADQQINIEAFEADRGRVCLLTSEPDKAADLLRSTGFQTSMDTAFAVSLDNAPGRLAELAETLGAAQVNIISIFGSARDGIVYLTVDDPAAAVPVLAGRDIVQADVVEGILSH